jgi:precorrin-6B methylase 2
MLTRRAFSLGGVAALSQIARLRPPDVKYVPTPQNVVDAMLAMARVTTADIVYDLGSGDGRIPISAAAQYRARGVGIEIDSFHLREAYDNLKKAGVGGRVRFLEADFFAVDISEATVVTMFLLPRVLLRLLPKFRRELRPGTRIVSHQYHFGDEWPAEQVQDVGGLMIYGWTMR